MKGIKMGSDTALSDLCDDMSLLLLLADGGSEWTRFCRMSSLSDSRSANQVRNGGGGGMVPRDYSHGQMRSYT